MTKLPAQGLYRAEIDQITAAVDGWYTDTAYSAPWDFDAPVTGNLDLYARWTNLSPAPVDLAGQSGDHVLAKALGYIAGQSLSEETPYAVVLAENYSLAGVSAANINTAQAVITLVGSSPVELSLSSAGALFSIGAGELILDKNITLTGLATNDRSLVYVDGSSTSLTMKAGAKITGNTAYGPGGGVWIGNASFTMEGGEISGNSVTSGYGGGVYVIYNGSFTMEGGEISGNSASSGIGGGVLVWRTTPGSNSFTMEGGEISGNTAAWDEGGGGGIGISGHYSSFNKTGGIIYGDTDGTHTAGSTENTATSGNTKGHAVYYYVDASTGYYRDATLNAGDNISTGAVPATATESYDSTNWIKKP
jgi:uncharacterized repeat protein (TIGR02543 family)